MADFNLDVLQSPMVKVIAGYEVEDPFFLHEKLLIEKSRRFASLLKGAWNEKKIREVQLRDVVYEDFSEFAIWLYQGTIGEPDVDEPLDRLKRVISFYKLGGELGSDDYKNAAIDWIIEAWISGSFSPIEESEVVEIVRYNWETLTEGPAMRLLLLELYADRPCFDIHSRLPGIYGVPSEFWRLAAQNLKDKINHVQLWQDTQNFAKNYCEQFHEHCGNDAKGKCSKEIDVPVPASPPEKPSKTITKKRKAPGQCNSRKITSRLLRPKTRSTRKAEKICMTFWWLSNSTSGSSETSIRRYSHDSTPDFPKPSTNTHPKHKSRHRNPRLPSPLTPRSHQRRRMSPHVNTSPVLQHDFALGGNKIKSAHQPKHTQAQASLETSP